jgi:hypothetical protein
MRCAASSPDCASRPRHHLEGVQDIGFRQRDGHGAAVGQQFDQAFGGQHLDGFAQRRARHVQQLRELALVELGAGCDGTFDQHLAQAMRHLFVQGGARDGDDFCAHCRDFVCKTGEGANTFPKSRGIDKRILYAKNGRSSNPLPAMVTLDFHPTGRHFLQIPGPSPVPDRILRAMSLPTIDHRGPEFGALGCACSRASRRSSRRSTRW